MDIYDAIEQRRTIRKFSAPPTGEQLRRVLEAGAKAPSAGNRQAWFAVIITVVTTLGAVTPPVGATTYVVGGMAEDVPLEAVFRGVLFFLPAYVLCVVILMLFPEIVTFLPNLMR